MTSATLQQELQVVEPGELARDFRFAQGMNLHGLREGIAPSESPLATAERVATWVATDSGTSHPHGVLGIALERAEDEGPAKIVLDPRVERVSTDPLFVRAALSAAMHESRIRAGVIDSQAIGIPAERLEEIGFHPTPAGQMHFLPDRRKA